LYKIPIFDNLSALVCWCCWN